MILDRVTITGADDSIDPIQLVVLADKYPFVEWGILLSQSREGSLRFPSFDWLKALEKVQHKLTLSGHLCGSWVRKICVGDMEFFKVRKEISYMFERIQLNFHANLHFIDEEKFISALKKFLNQFIFQLDNINNEILSLAIRRGINAAPLFDLSGGAGVLPTNWPKATRSYCGYAGGLSPDNVVEQLRLIKQVARDNRIWIDVETHVRSQNDAQFDLVKVRDFLENVKPWVTYRGA